MSKRSSGRQPEQNQKRLFLYPLQFEEAIKAILKVKPEARKQNDEMVNQGVHHEKPTR